MECIFHPFALGDIYPDTHEKVKVFVNVF
jgi:hypothetical protein